MRKLPIGLDHAQRGKVHIDIGMGRLISLDKETAAAIFAIAAVVLQAEMQWIATAMLLKWEDSFLTLIFLDDRFEGKKEPVKIKCQFEANDRHDYVKKHALLQYMKKV